MMTLDDYLSVGETQELGSHTFTAEEIVAFATKYDPQPFHLSEEAARGSVFGRLCASGWHTAAMWMRHNVQTRNPKVWTGEGPAPQVGPSPGFENLRWLKPAYAGETIRFTRTTLGHRAMTSRTGWRIVSGRGEAFDSTGDRILNVDTAVLFKTG